MIQRFSGKRIIATLTAATIGTVAMADADLIVINADIYTVDPAAPRVEAFAVESGKFTAVGTNAEIRALADSDTSVIDAQGRTITPGFIDGHSHVSGNSPAVASGTGIEFRAGIARLHARRSRCYCMEGRDRLNHHWQVGGLRCA